MSKCENSKDVLFVSALFLRISGFLTISLTCDTGEMLSQNKLLVHH